MSLIDLNIDDPENRAAIQRFVRQWLTNSIPRLNLPDKLELKIDRKQHHLAIEWEGQVEAVLGAIGLPDPDLLRARVYEDHAIVDLRFSNIRIDYS
ncbi:MAG: hypothetical protein GY903_01210 [Fuerstiella sp.]|nr:hypothetical protein [Fuerstiella sp.]MCP4853097.1 hypothetical protein [Fuerstiella sp.]